MDCWRRAATPTALAAPSYGCSQMTPSRGRWVGRDTNGCVALFSSSARLTDTGSCIRAMSTEGRSRNVPAIDLCFYDSSDWYRVCDAGSFLCSALLPLERLFSPRNLDVRGLDPIVKPVLGYRHLPRCDH